MDSFAEETEAVDCGVAGAWLEDAFLELLCLSRLNIPPSSGMKHRQSNDRQEEIPRLAGLAGEEGEVQPRCHRYRIWTNQIFLFGISQLGNYKICSTTCTSWQLACPCRTQHWPAACQPLSNTTTIPLLHIVEADTHHERPGTGEMWSRTGFHHKMRTDEAIDGCADPLWLFVCHPRVSLHGIAITSDKTVWQIGSQLGPKHVAPSFSGRWLIPQAYFVALVYVVDRNQEANGTANKPGRQNT